MQLGVCYYPEHWPESRWESDAAHMHEIGIRYVRIGEFSWSRIEPDPGRYDWRWLDKAVEILAAAGLKIILGTPTATPPKWLHDQMPDMVAIDEKGNPRNFGSRRHYCFSHTGYRAAAVKIAEAMVKRYGNHPAIAAWQIDNEYGCHDTILSYSNAAANGFRQWLQDKYGDIGKLNTAWGTVFWSMEYRSFDEIDPPLLTVTEPQPSHVLDYRRFASNQVAIFNRLQTDIVRKHAPNADIMHNFMGFFTEFDHHKVSKDIDVAGWDSYPLGFLEQFFFSDEEKSKYGRTSHPDIAAFHHDLYRGCTEKERWWVAEQQPGPVNWARYNPAPLPGMVRLWTLEAMAHGAELVSYFRWRQAPFAQEQMHSGLLRPDGSEDTAAGEARQVAKEIMALPDAQTEQAPVALMFDYESVWATQIQPQGQNYNGLELTFRCYEALRRLGLNVDIISKERDFDGYKIMVIPNLLLIDEAMATRLGQFSGEIIFGPRSGSKTSDLQIPDNLPPGPLRSILPIKVNRVESLRPGLESEGKTVDGQEFRISRWLEHLEIDDQVQTVAQLSDGRPVAVCRAKITYLAAWPDSSLWRNLIESAARKVGIPVQKLPEGLAFRKFGQLCFACNYGPQSINLAEYFESAESFNFKLGGPQIGTAQVAIWEAA